MMRERMSMIGGEGKVAKVEHHTSLRSSLIFQGTDGLGGKVCGKVRGMV